MYTYSVTPVLQVVYFTQPLLVMLISVSLLQARLLVALGVGVSGKVAVKLGVRLGVVVGVIVGVGDNPGVTVGVGVGNGVSTQAASVKTGQNSKFVPWKLP